MNQDFNEAVARQFLTAVTLGDGEAIKGLSTPEATARIMGYSDISGSQPMADWAASLSAFATQVQTPFEIAIDRVISDGDQVSVECSSKIAFNNGHVYQNQYSYNFTVVDGLVTELREFTDTATAMASFAELK